LIIDLASDRPGTYRDATLYRCLFNGEDVSSRCFYADDTAGIVRLYTHDPPQRGLDGLPIWQELRGDVRLVLKSEHETAKESK
jgi:hypothetical protein